MSEQSTTTAIDPGTVVTEPRGTIGVERKVNIGNYESETISIFVQFPISFGDEDATALAANDAAFLAKSVVYSQLGLPTELTDGVLKVKSAFPGATVNQPVENLAPPTQPAATAAPSAPAASGEPVCPVCSGGMYDNRPKNVERVAAGQKPIPEARCRNYPDPPKGTGCSGILWSIAKGK